jgi:hypothetical protein
MKKFILFTSIFTLLAITSCKKDYIVTDITGKTITVNAPANNLVTSNNVVTFWWEVLDGAEKYSLQVVKPNFASITQLITDTNITANKINIALKPGTYQWRIRATNGATTTAYQVFNLKVDSSNVLTNQFVIPISPLTGYITRSKTIDFTWNTLPAATSYSIELKMNSTVINSTTTANTNYQYTFPTTSASNYVCSWRIKAINASSISQFNTTQTFTIDILPPAISTPSTPTVSTLVKDTIDLVWKRVGGTDTKMDSLYVYSDAGFVNLVSKTVITTTKIKINQINPNNPLTAGTSSTTPIQYWWRLKSLDSLGNTSGYSSSLNFLLH